jgi:hypothetical protein
MMSELCDNVRAVEGSAIVLGDEKCDVLGRLTAWYFY